MASDALRAGKAIVIKGLIGFHLACDARDEHAVACLRARKRRDAKPLAVMVSDLDMVRRFCTIDPPEEAALTGSSAPIVVLNPRQDGARQDGEILAKFVAMGQDTLGIMLPYTPLHHLLLADFDGPLVMTSGNASDEPQAISNHGARDQLGGIADAFLMHDRDIVNRVDDSVGRVKRGTFQLLRRGRGFGPAPIAYPPGFALKNMMLAMGSELKNTFALTTPDGIVVSPHCGDLDNPQAAQAYRDTIALYQKLYDVTPQTVCVDAHPDYHASTAGIALAGRVGATVQPIAHHHGHIASVLGDNGCGLDEPPVIGLAFDGLGLGEDGTLWGGEIMVASYRDAQRIGRLPAVAMPGGERAAREPWRNLIAHLHAAGIDPHCAGFDQRATQMLVQMMERGLNAPVASSAGRLFDAFAALLGLHSDGVAFEGQAAMAVEVLALRVPALDASTTAQAYQIDLVGSQGGASALKALWTQALHDKREGVAPATMALRFHTGLANALAQRAADEARTRDIHTIALSGGVFLNRLLTRFVVAQLEDGGFHVLTHRQLPCNEGGLSFGQILIGLAKSGGQEKAL